MTSARHCQLTANRPRPPGHKPGREADGIPASADRSPRLRSSPPRRLPPRLSTAQGPRPSVTMLLLSPTEHAALRRRPSADLAFSKQYIVGIRRVGRSATLCNQPSPRARAHTPAQFGAAEGS